MKKFACFIVTLIMILVLASCGQAEATSTSTEDELTSVSIEIEGETNPDTEDADSAEDDEATVEDDEDISAAEESETEAEETTETNAADNESDTDSESTVTETSASFTVEEADETVYVYNTSSLNVRTGPGTEYKAIGSLSYGESVHQTGTCNNGWYRIEYNDETAYASGKYLSTEKPAATTSSSSSSTYPLTYSDNTCTITITKEWYENAWCYIAHLQFTDYSRFGTACANGKYNNGYETTSGAAKRLGAVFCVNGDYSAPYLGYTVVRSGVVCNDKSCTTPGVYSSHTGVFSSPDAIGVSGTLVSTLVANGSVTDTFCFGPAFLVNGVVSDSSDNSRAQRTFMGTNSKAGDIYIVVSDGRYNDGSSAGLTYQQCAQLLKNKGCTFGIPLDGGGSSTMYFNGSVLNAASGNERAVVDFVYFK